VPGAYVPAVDERPREREARHALTVRAAVAQLPTESVVSHVSAAVLHGLPVEPSLARVHHPRPLFGWSPAGGPHAHHTPCVLMRSRSWTASRSHGGSDAQTCPRGAVRALRRRR
jgi:hypothetical protein